MIELKNEDDLQSRMNSCFTGEAAELELILKINDLN
jgi:hypothetical protein